LTLSAVAAATFLLWKLLPKNSDKSNLPPLVKGSLPVLGHLLQLQHNPREFIQHAKDKYGPCFRLKLPGQGTLVVVTGELIPEVMKATKDFNFPKGVENLVPTSRIVELSYGHKFIAEKVSPRAKNPVSYPIKHNFKEHQIVIFSKRIQTALKRGLGEVLNIPKGEKRTVNMLETLSYVVSCISCPCFAVSHIDHDKEFIKGMAVFTRKIIRAGIALTLLPGWLGQYLLRSYFSVEHEMDLIMTRLVPELEKVRAGAEIEPTFATMALSVPKEDGTFRPVADVAYHFKDVALASIHTTSHFATLSLHELACRPELIQALREELKTLQGDLTPESVATLTLMDSFLREVFRCNADYLGLPHLTMRDTLLSSGHIVPEGAMVVLALDQAHHDPAYIQSADLNTFDPYRFTKENTSLKSTTIGLNHLSFGIGAHACPGRYFAVNEIKYMIAELITRYDVSTKTGKRAKDFVLLGMTKFPPNEPLIFCNKEEDI
jgi:cytochrome P450